MPLSKQAKKDLVSSLFRTMTNNPKYNRRFKRDYMWDVLYRTLVNGKAPTETVDRLRSIYSEKQIDNLLVKVYDQYIKEGNLP